MAEEEQELADGTIRHQIHIDRMSAGITNRDVERVRDWFGQVADALKRVNIGDALNEEQLDAKLAAALGPLVKILDSHHAQTIAEIRKLAEQEAGFQSRLWDRTLG